MAENRSPLTDLELNSFVNDILDGTAFVKHRSVDNNSTSSSSSHMMKSECGENDENSVHEIVSYKDGSGSVDSFNPNITGSSPDVNYLADKIAQLKLGTPPLTPNVKIIQNISSNNPWNLLGKSEDVSGYAFCDANFSSTFDVSMRSDYLNNLEQDQNSILEKELLDESMDSKVHLSKTLDLTVNEINDVTSNLAEKSHSQSVNDMGPEKFDSVSVDDFSTEKSDSVSVDDFATEKSDSESVDDFAAEKSDDISNLESIGDVAVEKSYLEPADDLIAKKFVGTSGLESVDDEKSELSFDLESLENVIAEKSDSESVLYFVDAKFAGISGFNVNAKDESEKCLDTMDQQISDCSNTGTIDKIRSVAKNVVDTDKANETKDGDNYFFAEDIRQKHDSSDSYVDNGIGGFTVSENGRNNVSTGISEMEIVIKTNSSSDVKAIGYDILEIKHEISELEVNHCENVSELLPPSDVESIGHDTMEFKHEISELEENSGEKSLELLLKTYDIGNSVQNLDFESLVDQTYSEFSFIEEESGLNNSKLRNIKDDDKNQSKYMETSNITAGVQNGAEQLFNEELPAEQVLDSKDLNSVVEMEKFNETSVDNTVETVDIMSSSSDSFVSFSDEDNGWSLQIVDNTIQRSPIFENKLPSNVERTDTTSKIFADNEENLSNVEFGDKLESDFEGITEKTFRIKSVVVGNKEHQDNSCFENQPDVNFVKIDKSEIGFEGIAQNNFGNNNEKSFVRSDPNETINQSIALISMDTPLPQKLRINKNFTHSPYVVRSLLDMTNMEFNSDFKKRDTIIDSVTEGGRVSMNNTIVDFEENAENISEAASKKLQEQHSLLEKLVEELSKIRKEKEFSEQRVKQLEIELGGEITELRCSLNEKQTKINALILEMEAKESSVKCLSVEIHNWETMYNNLSTKFIEGKKVALDLRKNEEELQKKISEREVTIAKLQKQYETLKDYANHELAKANCELETIEKKHNLEMIKLRSLCTSLQSSLDSKTKENAELLKVSNDLCSYIDSNK